MKIKEQIFELIKKYFNESKKIIPSNQVPVSRKIFNEEEMINATDAILNQWWTEQNYSKKLESLLNKFIGTKFCILVLSIEVWNISFLKSA